MFKLAANPVLMSNWWFLQSLLFHNFCLISSRRVRRTTAAAALSSCHHLRVSQLISSGLRLFLFCFAYYRVYMAPRNKTSNAHGPKLPWDQSDPNFPNSQTDTKRWVAASDNLCKRRFDPSQPLPYDHHRGQTDAQFAGTMNENVLQEIIGARRLTCASQLQLSRNITRMFTEMDFEDKWLALGEDGQEKYLLRAFKAHESGPAEGFAMHGPEKLNCPEVCRDELVKDGGRGFLDLLKMFLLDNNDEQPTQPFLTPSARFDAIIGWVDDEHSPNLKAWLSLRRLLRTRYIGKFLATSE